MVLNHFSLLPLDEQCTFRSYAQCLYRFFPRTHAIRFVCAWCSIVFVVRQYQSESPPCVVRISVAFTWALYVAQVQDDLNFVCSKRLFFTTKSPWNLNWTISCVNAARVILRSCSIIQRIELLARAKQQQWRHDYMYGVYVSILYLRWPLAEHHIGDHCFKNTVTCSHRHSYNMEKRTHIWNDSNEWTSTHIFDSSFSAVRWMLKLWLLLLLLLVFFHLFFVSFCFVSFRFRRIVCSSLRQ